MSIIGDPEFVEKLEKKLAKFRKPPEKLNSKDILADFSHRRQNLVFTSGDDDAVLEGGSRLPEPNILVQKLYPEKVAVASDEIQTLVDKDELGIFVERLFGADEQSKKLDDDASKQH